MKFCMSTGKVMLFLDCYNGFVDSSNCGLSCISIVMLLVCFGALLGMFARHEHTEQCVASRQHVFLFDVGNAS